MVSAHQPKLHVWWLCSSKAPIIVSYEWFGFHVTMFLIMMKILQFVKFIEELILISDLVEVNIPLKFSPCFPFAGHVC
jgi:hypothetical protein